MKATFATRDMKDALKFLSIMKKDGDDTSLQVKITAAGKKLFLTRNTARCSAETFIPANVEQEGCIIVKIADLSSIIRQAADDIIFIDFDPNYQFVKLIIDGDSFMIEGIKNVNNVLKEDAPAVIAHERFNIAVLQDFLNPVLPVLESTVDDGRRFKHYCRLFVDDGRLSSFATDTVRIVFVQDSQAGNSSDIDCFIPYNMALLISKYDDITADVVVDVYENETANELVVSFDNVTLRAESPSFDLPDPIDWLEKNTQPVASIVFDTKDVLEKAKRMQKLASKVEYKALRLNFESDKLTMSVIDRGEKLLGTSSVPCGLDGKPFLVSVNANFFVDMLSAVSVRCCRVMLNKAKNALVFKGEHLFKFTGVLALIGQTKK